MGYVLGYARVSTGDQDVAGQTMRLERAGAIRVFTDVKSGKSMDRPGLIELLAYARKGDTLAVVRLDRLGRSLGRLRYPLRSAERERSSARSRLSTSFGKGRAPVMNSASSSGRSCQSPHKSAVHASVRLSVVQRAKVALPS
jgi:Resolvase, N terminal domain